MPAEKRDGHTGADIWNVNFPEIFLLIWLLLDQSTQDQPWVLFPVQSPAAPHCGCNPVRTSGFVTQFACCFFWPGQKLVSDSRATGSSPAGAAPLAMSDGYKAAESGGI